MPEEPPDPDGNHPPAPPSTTPSVGNPFAGDPFAGDPFGRPREGLRVGPWLAGLGEPHPDPHRHPTTGPSWSAPTRIQISICSCVHRLCT